MTKRQKEGLARIGVSTKRYCLDGDYGPDDGHAPPWSFGEYPNEVANWAIVPVWGLSLVKDGEEVAVIESTVHEIDKRFHLRLARRGIDVGVYKTQREAVAGWLRREYRIAA